MNNKIPKLFKDVINDFVENDILDCGISRPEFYDDISNVELMLIINKHLELRNLKIVSTVRE